MRLIDADALRDRVYHEAFETDTPDQKWDSGCWIRYKMFERNIKNAPTIDAVPVKHGRWINDNCSECGLYVYHGDMRNYCPNCGARMDGDCDE